MTKEQIRSVIAAGVAQCRSPKEIFDQLPPGSVTIRQLMRLECDGLLREFTSSAKDEAF